MHGGSYDPALASYLDKSKIMVAAQRPSNGHRTNPRRKPRRGVRGRVRCRAPGGRNLLSAWPPHRPRPVSPRGSVRLGHGTAATRKIVNIAEGLCSADPRVESEMLMLVVWGSRRVQASVQDGAPPPRRGTTPSTRKHVIVKFIKLRCTTYTPKYT